MFITTFKTVESIVLVGRSRKRSEICTLKDVYIYIYICIHAFISYIKHIGKMEFKRRLGGSCINQRQFDGHSTELKTLFPTMNNITV